jgi:signal transduction histidine kinase
VKTKRAAGIGVVDQNATTPEGFTIARIVMPVRHGVPPDLPDSPEETPMDTQNPPQIESRIARCRLILSIVALAAVFADPTTPFVSAWFPLASGHFIIDPNVLLVMGLHLVFSMAVYAAAMWQWVPLRYLTKPTTWIDVLLGGAIAFVTEGATSPFYPFFAFAVVVAGFRSGLNEAMRVTFASVAIYLAMIVVSASESWNIYIMRPAYLAIVGYLVGYLGQQRLELQQEIQQLEAAEQRHRIARDLHDGFAQALAGINLRIEGCLRSLKRSNVTSRADANVDEAVVELTELQESVDREYDELRAYMKELAGIRPSGVTPASAGANTHIDLGIRIDGSVEFADHVLQIAREGLSNIRRHAAAATARIQISIENAEVRITIEDDGVGLQERSAPWSIASRVKELGGRIEVADDDRRGSHMLILLPQA